MGRKMQVLVIYCLCFFLLGAPKKPVRQQTFVTGITVTGQHRQQWLYRQYRQPGTVLRMLSYLRNLEYQGYAPVEPEQLSGDSFWIRVHLSDGGERVYRQRCNGYVSRDGKPWKQVEQTQARRLWYLLLLMPSDSVANEGVSCYNTPKGRW